MTEKEYYRRRFVLLKQQLELIEQYPEWFDKTLGKKGTEDFINSVLDEMIIIIQKLKEYEQ